MTCLTSSWRGGWGVSAFDIHPFCYSLPCSVCVCVFFLFCHYLFCFCLCFLDRQPIFSQLNPILHTFWGVIGLLKVCRQVIFSAVCEYRVKFSGHLLPAFLALVAFDSTLATVQGIHTGVVGFHFFVSQTTSPSKAFLLLLGIRSYNLESLLPCDRWLNVDRNSCMPEILVKEAKLCNHWI